MNDSTINTAPIECIIKDMINLEQFVKNVINYTSKYNINFSISYSPENLIGKYVKYPSYGDFPETYFLRTYGKWWKDSEAYQRDYRPQDVDPLGAEDYIILGFDMAVIPRHVCIYETYNPGAVVRIWARFTGGDWKLLWEGLPQICPDESRKFHPAIRKLNCLVNEIRLEFNQSNLKYHTALDAVLLGGYQPKYLLQYKLLQQDLTNWVGHRSTVSNNNIDNRKINEDNLTTLIPNSSNVFSKLPYEVIMHIFQYLDLKSLSQCAQVNKIWHQATLDPSLYQSLSLKGYWNKVTENTLNYFAERCQNIKKLDLSWCGNDSKYFSINFIIFLKQCCEQSITHLSLCDCNFVNNPVMMQIAECTELTELRLRNAKAVDRNGLKYLSKLNKLITLDLYSTNINDDALISILRSNNNLQNLNLDFCEYLDHLDLIIEQISLYNKNLISWSSWKATTLTSISLSKFSKLIHLKQLDLGWCLLFTTIPDNNCLEEIAKNCEQLQRLILSQWRNINEEILIPVLNYCKNLKQLDLLGIKNITNDLCERILMSLPKLELLEISFCDSVQNEQVTIWRLQYPHVTIQRSCQHVVNDYWN